MISAFRRLSFNQRSTLALGCGSLIMGVSSFFVAAAALYTSLTSKDMGNAIGQLQTLAKHAQSQADAMKFQQTTLKGQMQAQDKAAAELGKQAAQSAKQSAMFSSELAISQKQLAASVRSLALYESNSKRAEIDSGQEYRRLAIDVTSIALPTAEDIGKRYIATMTLTNKGNYPVSIEGQMWGIFLINESVDDKATRVFEEAEESLKRQVGKYITLSPGETHQVFVSPYSPISQEMLDKIDRGYRMLAYAAFKTKDPRGGSHFEYVCRFSDKFYIDQSCATPLAR